VPSFDLIKHRDRDSIEQQSPTRVQEITTETDEQVELSVELYNQYRSSQDDWATEATQSDEFLHNVMLTKEQMEDLEERGQSPLPINVVWPAVEQGVAMLTTNKPSFQVTAREDSDVKTAKVITDLLAWVWERSSGNEKLKTAIYDYYVKGRGVLQGYIDPLADFGKGEVMIQDVDPLDVYPDPNSKDRLWRDAAHVLVSKIKTREQLENLWPEAASLLEHEGSVVQGEDTWTTGNVATENQQLRGQNRDMYHEKFRVIERYTKVKLEYIDVQELFSDVELIFLTDSDEYREYMDTPVAIVSNGKQQQIVSGDKEMAQIEELWQEAQPTDDERVRVATIPEEQLPTGEVVPEQRLEIAKLKNTDLVLMGQIETNKYLQTRIMLVISIGNSKYWEGYLPIDEYPIVPLNNRHARTPYPTE